MKNTIAVMLFVITSFSLSGQKAIKFNLNDSGTAYIQATMLNQTWIRFNESNPGTLVNGLSKNHTFDIGLRRTRIQLIGQMTDKILIYFQFGQNNFNAVYNAGSNRKLAAFFHDALGEIKVFKGNELKLGAGLTIANGLSRFSQPSIGTIMTMDVPVSFQTTVDQTDQFSRKLSLYARGQLWKFDYRFILTEPFPVSSSGKPAPSISNISNFAQVGASKQGQGYLIFQFFDHEPHTTPYMSGTYLGTKKIFNIAAGFIYQKDAMWKTSEQGDTIYQDMKHFAIETFLDIPLSIENHTLISAYAGYFNLNYGTNFLRYNGLMNPANATNSQPGEVISGHGPVFGNAYPMFGSGHSIYTQFGLLLPKQLTGELKFMPYISATFSKYDYFKGLWTNFINAGLNYFIKEQKAKLTLDWQNRPTYSVENSKIKSGSRKNALIIQFQIYF